MSEYSDSRPPEGQGRALRAAAANGRALQQYDPYQIGLEDDDRIDLREYWRMLVKRKWTIVTVTAICFVSALLVTLLTIPEYRATATVQISPEAARILGYEDFTAEQGGGRNLEFYNTQYEILRSRSLAKDVVESNGFASHPELNGEIRQRGLMAEARAISGLLVSSVKDILGEAEGVAANGAADVAEEPRNPVEAALGPFRERVSVSPVRNSQLVEVSFTSFDPELAAEAANAVVAAYSESTLERRYEAGEEARKFLESQLEEMRIQLERSDVRLQEFAEQHGIADLEERISNQTTALRRLNEDLSDVESELLRLETWRTQIQEGRVDHLDPVRDDERLNDLERRLNEASSEYSSLSQRFGERYPDMIELRERMDSLRQQIEERRASIVDSILSRYDSLIAQKERLEEAINEREGRILALNQRSVQYNILRREHETNRELYDGLLQRMKEIGVSAGAQEHNIAVIDEAQVPRTPFKPDMTQNLSLALLLGVVGGAGLALLLEFLDRTVRQSEELERIAGAPVLGLLPLVRLRGRLRSDRRLKQPERAIGHYSFNYPKSSLAEAARSLRTSLTFSGPEGMPGALLVTSCGPGDGKSTVALNLATVLAQTGARVLLIDADVRKPRLHRDFGRPRKPGLTNRIARLRGEEDRASVVTTTDIEELYLMPCGTHAPNPAELLGSTRMRETLENCREKYDHVIVDSAPVIGLADSLLLSQVVDGVLLVAASGQTGKDSVRSAVKRLRQVEAPLLGTVLNAVDLNSPDYSYYTAYYYSYGDKDEEAELDEPKRGLLGRRRPT